MSRASVIGACAALVSLIGCIPTALSPFYAEDDLVFDPALVGKWVDEDGSTLMFEQSGPKSYTMIEIENNVESEFKAHLFKIGDLTFLDVFPTEPKCDSGDYYMLHLLPLHSFLYVTQVEPELHLSTFDYDWLGKYLDEHPDAIAHTVVESRIIFTAPTEELQAFMLEHLETEGALGEEQVFTKVER